VISEEEDLSRSSRRHGGGNGQWGVVGGDWEATACMGCLEIQLFILRSKS